MHEKTIIGGIIYDYLKETNSDFIEYIAVKNDKKQKGIGTNLLLNAIKTLNQKSKTKKIDFIFCEVEKEINGKQAKHYFWQKFGFTKINFDYIQPPLDKNKKTVFIMELGYLSFIISSRKITKQTIIKILNEVYTDYIDNEYFIKSINNLKKTKKI